MGASVRQLRRGTRPHNHLDYHPMSAKKLCLMMPLDDLDQMLAKTPGGSIHARIIIRIAAETWARKMFPNDPIVPFTPPVSPSTLARDFEAAVPEVNVPVRTVEDALFSLEALTFIESHGPAGTAVPRRLCPWNAKDAKPWHEVRPVRKPAARVVSIDEDEDEKPITVGPGEERTLELNSPTSTVVCKNDSSGPVTLTPPGKAGAPLLVSLSKVGEEEANNTTVYRGVSAKSAANKQLTRNGTPASPLQHPLKSEAIDAIRELLEQELRGRASGFTDGFCTELLQLVNPATLRDFQLTLHSETHGFKQVVTMGKVKTAARICGQAARDREQSAKRRPAAEAPSRPSPQEQLEHDITMALVFGEGRDWAGHVQRADNEARLRKLEAEQPELVAAVREKLRSEL